MRENKFRWICEGVNAITFFVLLCVDFTASYPGKLFLQVDNGALSAGSITKTSLIAYICSALIIWIGWLSNRETLSDIRFSSVEKYSYREIKIAARLKLVRYLVDWIAIVLVAGLWILILLMQQYNGTHIQGFSIQCVYVMSCVIFTLSVIQMLLSLGINIMINIYLVIGNNRMRQ